MKFKLFYRSQTVHVDRSESRARHAGPLRIRNHVEDIISEDFPSPLIRCGRQQQRPDTFLTHDQNQPLVVPSLIIQPSSSTEARDFDLDLKSEWYAKSPPAFPPKSMKVDGKITHAISMGWSGNGTRKIHTFTAHIRFLDTLASAKIHLTWDASNPAVTVKAQQKHYPPPRKLQSSELEAYGQK